MSVPPTRIVYADDGCCVAVRGPLALSVWPGAPTLARLTRAWEIVRDEARARGAPLVLLSVVPGGAPLVALADLPAIGREMMASRSATLALCIAFEGHGVWAERALEVATLADAARVALGAGALSRRYTTSVEEAATWLASQLRKVGDETLGRPEILEAVDLARAAVGA